MYTDEPWTLFRSKKPKKYEKKNSIDPVDEDIKEKYVKTANEVSKILKYNYKSVRKVLEELTSIGTISVRKKYVNNRPLIGYYLPPQKLQLIKEQIKEIKKRYSSHKETSENSYNINLQKVFNFCFETKKLKFFLEISKK